MTVTRAAVYARVSSSRQRESHTIENQLRVLPEYVRAQGWTLAGTYVDDGRSAKAGKLEAREGFARLVRDAEAGAFDALVVVDIDRLTRTDDMRERAEILGPFQRAGIRIVTPSGGELDLRTMLGELYVTLQAIVAAEENRKRAERVKAGKLRAIAEGRKPAGPTPYGLAYSRASGQWSLHAVAAEIVREIFRRVIAGESCAAIADDLHARDVVRPRGEWSKERVWQIVRSRHPVGEWMADKRRHLVVRVPAIIDEATWQAAQQRLIAHGKRGLRRTKHVYLLEGLAVCSRCGSPIAIRSPTPGRRPGVINAPAYVCRDRKLARRGEARCDAPTFPVAEIDARVWEIIGEAVASDELAQAIAARLEARDANRRDWARDVASYRAKLDALVKREAGMLARFHRGTISAEALDLALPQLQRDRGMLQAQLDRAQQAARDADVPQASADAVLSELRTLAASDAPAARQRVVRVFVERGGAELGCGSIRLTLSVAVGSRAAGAGGEGRAAPAIALVRNAGCRTSPENSAEIIQIVAVG